MIMRQAALILLAAGAVAFGSGGAQAVPRPSVCPSGGNSSPPFYAVTATNIGHGREVRIAGNYRVKDRNRSLSLTKSAENSTILKLRLRSSHASGHAAGCPHFGGSFSAKSSVRKVQITDWNKKRITIRVARPPSNVSGNRAKTT
jgi:hypothetical protein